MDMAVAWHAKEKKKRKTENPARYRLREGGYESTQEGWLPTKAIVSFLPPLFPLPPSTASDLPSNLLISS